MEPKHFHATENKKKNQKGEILISPALNGLGQMACDVLMLEKIQTETNTSMSVRFYQWEGIWLSIGKNQKELPQNWIDLAKRKKIKLVRRPTGGSAVLHSGGLTYSLAWNSPPKKKHLAYLEATKWLVNCFKGFGLNLKLGNQASTLPSGNCFNTSTLADLVDEEGIKRVGSAQFWEKGNLLQHGEILLNPPQKLWVEVFHQPPPPKAPMSISRIDLEKKLIRQIFLQWPHLKWTQNEFTSFEIQKVVNRSKFYSVNLSKSDS